MSEGKERPRKLLFICSRNKIRSLTAQKIFERRPGLEARSAGTQPGARAKVTEGLLGWADDIFFMEKSHLQRVREKFPEALEGKRLAVLHLRDEFTFMQPELIDELESKIASYLANLP